MIKERIIKGSLSVMLATSMIIGTLHMEVLKYWLLRVYQQKQEQQGK